MTQVDQDKVKPAHVTLTRQRECGARIRLATSHGLPRSIPTRDGTSVRRYEGEWDKVRASTTLAFSTCLACPRRECGGSKTFIHK